jgi:predicted DNA-binding transcriptional regulator YafY
MSGALANYQPRRRDEIIIDSNPEGKYRDIEANIDYWFWFRQRILKYGSNARILSPQCLVDEIDREYKKICDKLSINENNQKKAPIDKL